MRYLTLFFSMLLIASIGAQAQSITDKNVRSSGFSQKKFKKAPRRVYINSFNVYFQVVGSAGASTTGGEQFGRVSLGTNTHMGVGLDGVDTEDFMQITNDLKKDFGVEAEIFKDKKFSETTVASSKNVPDYYRVVFVGNNSTSVSHYAQADRGLYVGESQRLLNEFIRVSLENFYKDAVK